MIEEIVLSFALGFIAFFATGIDDTLTYAGSYLHNGKTTNKKMITIGIFIGTTIALALAKFAGELMHAVPERHLIGGGILILLGSYVSIKETYLGQKLKLLKPTPPKHQKPSNYILLGVMLFFATGLDDVIAYSNLMIANKSWQFLSLGVISATIVSVLLANRLSKQLRKIEHPERIGGTIIAIIGLLLITGIL